MADLITFHVVQYNAFIRPYIVSHDGQMERMARIPDALVQLNSGDIDTIVFCEIDFQVDEDVPITSPTNTQQLTNQMLGRFNELGFAHHTRVLNPNRIPPAATNGGVLIVSKWPIIRTESIAYRSFDSTDGLAAKGVMYAAIEKKDGGNIKTFHLFATHMQAWYFPSSQKVRAEQAEQLRLFVDQLALPASEPVVFAGDLNVDMVLYPEELERLLVRLQAKLPEFTGGQRYTSDRVHPTFVAEFT